MQTCLKQAHSQQTLCCSLAPHCCNAGNEEIASRRGSIVAELSKVQDKFGNGYLSAFPTEHFDRLQDLKPVWAPYYVVSAVKLLCEILVVKQTALRACVS